MSSVLAWEYLAWCVINGKVHYFYLNFCKADRLNLCSAEASLFKSDFFALGKKH